MILSAGVDKAWQGFTTSLFELSFLFCIGGLRTPYALLLLLPMLPVFFEPCIQVIIFRCHCHNLICRPALNAVPLYLTNAPF